MNVILPYAAGRHRISFVDNAVILLDPPVPSWHWPRPCPIGY
jgi:hypothetical protein